MTKSFKIEESERPSANRSDNQKLRIIWYRLKKLTEQAADFLLPPVCLNCHLPLEEGNRICPSCWGEINFITPPICQITGRPLPFHIGKGAISPSAIANPPHYDQARAVAHYKTTMRTLIHKLKYQDRHETISLFALWLEQAGQEFIPKTDLIIPIPLHSSRLWTRRFNQSTLIAKRLGQRTGLPVATTLLKRAKKTRSQVGLSAKERKTNMSGAFAISEEKKHLLENKTVLLIDDVMTTGATVNAAAKLLKQKGAISVNVLALAHTLTDE